MLQSLIPPNRKRANLRTLLLYFLLFGGVFALLLDPYYYNHLVPYVKSADLAQGLPEPMGSYITQRLLLVGDVGSVGASQQTLELMEVRARALPDRTTVVFLGDNVYPNGYPYAQCCTEPVPALDAQLALLRRSGTRGFFVPGNHDWAGIGQRLYAVSFEAQYIAEHTQQNAQLLPVSTLRDARTVAAVDLDAVRLVFLDTTWWLQERTEDERAEQKQRLATLLQDGAESKTVIVCGHHPIASYGTHRGYHGWLSYPMPDWLWRWTGGDEQDFQSARYQQMVADLHSVLHAHPPLLYAAGHDHSLQILKSDTDRFYSVVSGGGAQPSTVWHGEDTEFAVSAAGFMEVDVLRNGGVELRVFTVPQISLTPVPVFTTWLQEPTSAVALGASSSSLWRTHPHPIISALRNPCCDSSTVT